MAHHNGQVPDIQVVKDKSPFLQDLADFGMVFFAPGFLLGGPHVAVVKMGVRFGIRPFAKDLAQPLFVRDRIGDIPLLKESLYLTSLQ